MRPARKLGRFVLPALLAVGLLAGCRQRSTSLNPVTGRVSYKGMQLQSGIIVFAPDTTRGESGPVCVGKIGPDGTFALATGDGQGAPAGWYRVTVASLATAAPAVSALPEKYRDPGLSLLTCEIKPDRPNQLDFNLD